MATYEIDNQAGAAFARCETVGRNLHRYLVQLRLLKAGQSSETLNFSQAEVRAICRRMAKDTALRFHHGRTGRAPGSMYY